MGTRIEYINVSGLRVDGRRPTEVRRIRAALGIYPGADGSAVVEHGNTKVVATVHGPREISSRAAASSSVSSSSSAASASSASPAAAAAASISSSSSDDAVITVEYSMTPFATSDRRKRRHGDKKLTEATLAVEQSFQAAILTRLYPHSEISIHIQVLQADGGAVAASINAATLALMDAGVAMKDFVIGCSLAYIQRAALLDPNYTETTGGGTELTLAVLPRSNNVTLATMDARLPMEAFEAALELGVAGCLQIYDILRNVLREHTAKKAAVHTAISVGNSRNKGSNHNKSNVFVEDEEQEEEKGGDKIEG